MILTTVFIKNRVKVYNTKKISNAHLFSCQQKSGILISKEISNSLPYFHTYLGRIHLPLMDRLSIKCVNKKTFLFLFEFHETW